MAEGLKVAIIAFATGWRDGLKLRDEGFELWGFNDFREDFMPDDADRWFQLHSLEYLEEHWPYWDAVTRPMWEEYWDDGGGIPLYMHCHYDGLDTSIEFPKAQIDEMLPNRLGRYHCGSLDWLVAFAILEGATAIHVYGVNLTYNGEPISSRACLEFWLGVAVGRGIEVKVESADLFYTFQFVRTEWQYGWDESRPIVEPYTVVGQWLEDMNRLEAEAVELEGLEDNIED